MKLVILDRDGVINQDSATFIKNPNEWIPIPGSLEAIALLNQRGYRVANTFVLARPIEPQTSQASHVVISIWPR